MDHYTHDGLTFDVRDAGPADGPVVVLLHGFPQHNDSWDAVIDRLTAQGYRCLAPNQRGYSSGARPPRRRDYRIPDLVGDLGALIDASGAQQVHLVGHDWGAAWRGPRPRRCPSDSRPSRRSPCRIRRRSSSRSLTSRQGLASWYMYFFQLPRLPEWSMLRRNGSFMSESAAAGRADAERWPSATRKPCCEPGALTAAINWYRAMPLSNPARDQPKGHPCQRFTCGATRTSP